MSDEQRKDEESEVEAQRFRRSANEEPSEDGEGDEDVEAHRMRKMRTKND